MARDVAQRDLDNAGFRISKLGDPKEGGDATKTDNTSVPRANSGAGSPGSSFLAAPADHVHPASTGDGGSSNASVELADSSCQGINGQAEEIVAEFNVDLSGFTAPRIEVAFSALVKAHEGQGSFKVRLGGTPLNVDGEVVATIDTSARSFEKQSNTGFIARPEDLRQIVKLTACTDSERGIAFIYGKTVKFRPAAEG